MFASYLKFWSNVLRCKEHVRSFLEFGANIGVNIKAIKALAPKAKLTAVEINETACKELSKIDGVQVINESILNFDRKVGGESDFVFTRGVLIHINPDELSSIYEKMYNSVNDGGYILVDEYYNPIPTMVNYRGNENRLFKRDFAGEILNKYSHLRLIDYGCTYYRDGCNDDSN